MESLDNQTIVLINDKLSEQELEKLFALKALKSNPSILENFYSFEKLVYVLNNLKPNVDVWEPPTILMFAKAVQILNNLEYNVNHPEIKEYIAQIAHNEGWVNLPDILKFAQPELNNIQPEAVKLDEEAKKLQEAKHLAVVEYLKN